MTPLTAEEIAELRKKATPASGVPDVAVLRRETLRRLLDEVERSRRIPLADEADVKKLLAIIERCRALLKRIEWSGISWDEHACPECSGEEPRDRALDDDIGHRPGCELAALIGAP